ncbi:site-specific integrase [Desulfosporosinus nitroreducens]|uniref:site-specific integrase n=1 Tax=Desulfosporosinus nitroreducens TaxID=2018668 RepID=UPI00207D566A|nr:site-specific integrase [Desulfosporosinus nitroreducens]MCO1599789.1 site-specific integrase [Desulfosporosinus nitroreducens]
MASITKRPNGSYQARIHVGRDIDGKQLPPRCVTKPTLKECKAAAREIEQELEDGKMTNVVNIRVASWIQKWLEDNKNNYSPSTYVLYLSYLKNHYQPFFKQMKFKDLKEIHIKRLRNKLLGEMSTTSTRRVLSCLRPIIYDAMKKKSPFEEIKLPKEAKVDYSDVPTPEIFKQIYNGVRGTRDESIILLAAWCGLRREEIFALKENDLDFKNNTIEIDEAYVINDQGKYELKSTKSENGLRLVSTPPYLMDLLKGVVKNGIKLKKPKKEKVTNIATKQTKQKKDRLIFPMRPDSYTSYLAKLAKKKNMPKIRMHFLRHYHATWLYENDVPDHLSAERLGHDIKVLKEIYQHLGVEKKKEINKKIIDLQQEECK